MMNERLRLELVQVPFFFHKLVAEVNENSREE